MDLPTYSIFDELREALDFELTDVPIYTCPPLEGRPDELPEAEAIRNVVDRSFRWTDAMCQHVADILNEHSASLIKLGKEKNICNRVSELVSNDHGLTMSRIYTHLVRQRSKSHARKTCCGQAYRDLVAALFKSQGREAPKRLRAEREKQGNISWEPEVCKWLVKQINANAAELAGMKRGKYVLIMDIWEQAIKDGSAPTKRLPSDSSLQSHLQLMQQRGLEHSCALTWKPYKRKSGGTKKPKLVEETVSGGL